MGRKTTVFSWKISNDDYGYLWTPETNSPCIRQRITKPESLKDIVDEVKTWNSTQYEEKFSQLNNLIHDNFGQGIEGEYTDYYYENTESDTSYIMLTGKDGSNADNISTNADIKEDVLNTLKTYISKEVSSSTVSFKTDINTFKTETTNKINALSSAVDTKINSAKNELSAITENVVDGKLNSIKNEVKTGVLNEINVDGLNQFINESNDRISNIESSVDVVKGYVSGNVETLRESVNNQNERLETISQSVETEISETNERLSKLYTNINVVNNKVERIAANKGLKDFSSEAEQESEILSFSKNGGNEEYMFETETVDNENGTFDIISRIGNEEYDIRILSYGNKLKMGESHVGLTLANNGLKYLDKSGAFISIINGNIRLSNADGSGKLEIKKDGLYINGVKQ